MFISANGSSGTNKQPCSGYTCRASGELTAAPWPHDRVPSGNSPPAAEKVLFMGHSHVLFRLSLF